MPWLGVPERMCAQNRRDGLRPTRLSLSAAERSKGEATCPAFLNALLAGGEDLGSVGKPLFQMPPSSQEIGDCQHPLELGYTRALSRFQ